MQLFVCALEPSANLHLKEILKHLKNVQIRGIFDKELGTPLYDSKEFGVMGIVDVIKIYKKAKKIFNHSIKEAQKSDFVLLIDSPAFNIAFAKKLKQSGFKNPIGYYILPQVWAWKKKRVNIVQKYCDYLFCILPFEKRFWQKAIFVGNLLMEEIKKKKETVLKTNTIAFLPGSRKKEIELLMPLFRDVAKRLTHKKLLLCVSQNFKNDLKVYGDISLFEPSFDVKKALLESEFAFICSGTATLESSIIGTPFVLVYKAKRLDYLIGRYFVKLPYVGLANLIFWFENLEPMHQEFLQKQATTKNLLNAYNSCNKEKFLQKSFELRKLLALKQSPSLIIANTIKGEI